MKKVLAVAALALVLTSVAQAQSASIGASATVATPLTVTAGQALAFGSVFPTFTRTILPTDATSGSFTLAGQAGAQVALTFTLPANLTFGANNLPVTYSTTAAAHNVTNSRVGATTINPATVNNALLDAGTGNLYVFIGGAVTPAAQPAGSYVGTITLAAAYTGN